MLVAFNLTDRHRFDFRLVATAFALPGLFRPHALNNIMAEMIKVIAP